MEEKLVSLRRFAQREEAYLVKAALQEHGIPSLVHEDFGWLNVWGGGPLGGAAVYVRASDRHQAERLLRSALPHEACEATPNATPEAPRPYTVALFPGSAPERNGFYFCILLRAQDPRTWPYCIVGEVVEGFEVLEILSSGDTITALEILRRPKKGSPQ